MERFVDGGPLRNLQGHADRTMVSLLNPVVSALNVVLFWRLARAISRHPATPIAVTVLFALGTPLWPYAGSFFSEPLTIFFLLLATAVLGLVPADKTSFGAGLALGCAVATHITAILAVPFVFIAFYCVNQSSAQKQRWLRLAFAGMCTILSAIAIFNFARFGGIFETGRFVPIVIEKFDYGALVPPWRGLYGLLVSPGKGLLIYSPAILLTLCAWPSLHRQTPQLSFLLIGMVLVRVMFVASRSNWHGGFCLGPRLLLLLVPFLMLPVVVWLDRRLLADDRAAVVGFGVVSVACIAQQVLFVLGHAHMHYHLARFLAMKQGSDAFIGDSLYLLASYSPALHLLETPFRGSWILRAVPADGLVLWIGLSISAAYAYAAGAWFLAWWCTRGAAVEGAAARSGSA